MTNNIKGSVFVIGSRLYAGHSSNKVFANQIESIHVKDEPIEEYLNVSEGIYSVRDVKFATMNNTNFLRGLPKVYMTVDVSLLAYNDNRTDSEFKIVTMDSAGEIVVDVNRETTSQFRYELNDNDLKEVISGGFYRDGANYERKLNEELRSSVFSDETSPINVSVYKLDDVNSIRVVNEQSFSTPISNVRESELKNLLQNGFLSVKDKSLDETHMKAPEPIVATNPIEREANQEIEINEHDLLQTDKSQQIETVELEPISELAVFEIEADEQLELANQSAEEEMMAIERERARLEREAEQELERESKLAAERKQAYREERERERRRKETFQSIEQAVNPVQFVPPNEMNTVHEQVDDGGLDR